MIHACKLPKRREPHLSFAAIDVWPCHEAERRLEPCHWTACALHNFLFHREASSLQADVYLTRKEVVMELIAELVVSSPSRQIFPADRFRQDVRKCVKCDLNNE